MQIEDLYSHCTLCARRCGVDRRAGKCGVCRMTDRVFVSRAALHFWEEPIISGVRGSGTVFFSGCSLGCVYCQNREISRGASGLAITKERLTGILLELQEKGAHNINFVTPTHYVPSVIYAVGEARARGLSIPIVYNTGSYETEETVDLLRGTVDIYLPDLKYATGKIAKAYSFAEDYPEVARRAIDRMVAQVGAPAFTEDGMLRRGVVVRILLLPGHVAEAKLSLSYLYKTYGDAVYISLMNQYTPMQNMKKPLDRTVTREEYRELVGYAEKLGVRNAFTQEFGTQSESFIPAFDHSGVLAP